MTEPKQSFDIDGCRAMLRKLEHELELCRSNDRRHLSGHLINFAMTAYHLIAWTLADLEEQPATKAKVAAEVGVREDQLDYEAFCKYVVTTCPGMDVCQAIANGTKHVRYDGKRAAKVIETYVSAGPSFVPTSGPGAGEPIFTGTPKVTVGGEKSGDVRETFDQVLQWWVDFIIKDHNIDRFNLPQSGG
jgi:hypothetical protein